MNTGDPAPRERDFLARTIEAAVLIGLLFGLVFWCFKILQPFIIPIFWGIILAVATYPGYQRLNGALGGAHPNLTATFVTILMLIVVIVPSVMMVDTVATGARTITRHLEAGTLEVPAPPESVKDWPLIGQSLYGFWHLASSNIDEAIDTVGPQIKAFGRWLLAGAAGAGLGILKFLAAIIISGILLAHAGAGERSAQAIGRRVVGTRGREFIEVAEATVRSVARGILGVALIQSLLAGLGFLAVGVPGAGLWALIALFLSVVQIGIFLVMIPIVVYVFYHAAPLTAVIFLIWSIFVSLIDNILKPILLGRGVRVPMVVIFVGAIGGFLAYGIIGLFVGAVVLALGYKLFQVWLRQESPASAEIGAKHDDTA
jgi:predicted PurR-regulated permease PerM